MEMDPTLQRSRELSASLGCSKAMCCAVSNKLRVCDIELGERGIRMLLTRRGFQWIGVLASSSPNPKVFIRLLGKRGGGKREVTKKKKKYLGNIQ